MPKLCNKCVYWKRGDSKNGDGLKFCHYCYINGHSRPRGVNGECLGYKKEVKRK